jgi:hypothetical protein
MPAITIPAITIRTTSSDSGHPHGTVIGTGRYAEDAFTHLAKQAREYAKQIAGALDTQEHAGQPDTDWSFEVIDLRLVAAGSPDSNTWAAVGTLCSIGATPWDVT